METWNDLTLPEKRRFVAWAQKAHRELWVFYDHKLAQFKELKAEGDIPELELDKIKTRASDQMDLRYADITVDKWREFEAAVEE